MFNFILRVSYTCVLYVCCKLLSVSLSCLRKWHLESLLLLLLLLLLLMLLLLLLLSLLLLILLLLLLVLKFENVITRKMNIVTVMVFKARNLCSSL